MDEKTLLKLKLKNAEGKRLLEKSILEYSREIIRELKNNPGILPSLLEKLEVTESEFFAYLSGESLGNVTLYDKALTLIKEKNNSKKY